MSSPRRTNIEAAVTNTPNDAEAKEDLQQADKHLVGALKEQHERNKRIVEAIKQIAANEITADMLNIPEKAQVQLKKDLGTLLGITVEDLHPQKALQTEAKNALERNLTTLYKAVNHMKDNKLTKAQTVENATEQKMSGPRKG